MTKREIETRLRNREWIRISRGVFRLASSPASRIGVLAVACISLGAVVSHEAAAELLDLPLVRRGLNVVTVAVRRTHEFAGVIIHQSTDLVDDHFTVVDGLPTTTVVRTLVDLAAVLDDRLIERVIDRCIAQRRTSIEELGSLVGEVSRRGKPGTAFLREYLQTRGADYIATESELEAKCLAAFREWGLPEPVLQHELPWRSAQRGRVDFAFVDEKILVEADGRMWHSTPESFDGDRKRDNYAQVAGWRVIRITWNMITRDPEDVRRTLEATLAVSPTR